MNQQGLKYWQQGNCFVWIEEYEEAQKLTHRQLEIHWTANGPKNASMNDFNELPLLT
jgi:hypothetical protein